MEGVGTTRTMCLLSVDSSICLSIKVPIDVSLSLAVFFAFCVLSLSLSALNLCLSRFLSHKSLKQIYTEVCEY